MKSFIVLCVVAVSCWAASAEESAAPLDAAAAAKAALRAQPALERSESRDELGQYELRYVTAEGTEVMERGRLVDRPDGEGKVLIYEGEYSYTGDDGKKYITKYTTDLGGHQPRGDHIPTPPPMPIAPIAPLAPIDAKPELKPEADAA